MLSIHFRELEIKDGQIFAMRNIVSGLPRNLSAFACLTRRDCDRLAINCLPVAGRAARKPMAGTFVALQWRRSAGGRTACNSTTSTQTTHPLSE
jgi:hypothetical protein